MNITRYAFSIALLFSVGAISAETEVTTENTQTTEQVAVSIEDIMNQVAADFNLSDEEMAALRTILEAASQEGGEIDIAAVVAEMRTEDTDENDAVNAAVDAEASEEDIQV